MSNWAKHAMIAAGVSGVSLTIRFFLLDDSVLDRLLQTIAVSAISIMLYLLFANRKPTVLPPAESFEQEQEQLQQVVFINGHGEDETYWHRIHNIKTWRELYFAVETAIMYQQCYPGPDAHAARENMLVLERIKSHVRMAIQRGNA